MKSSSVFRSIQLAALATTIATGTWYAMDRSAPSASDASTSASGATLAATPEAAQPETVATEPSAAAEAGVRGSGLLFSPPKNIRGKAIDLRGVVYRDALAKGQHVIGRVGDLDAESFAGLMDVAEGETVSFPGFSGALRGTVEVAVIEDGWHRIGGPLEGGRSMGWFTFSTNGEKVSGLVRVESEHLAYQVQRAADGSLQMTEYPLRELVCMGMPRSDGGRTRAAAPFPAPEGAVVTPLLNSRPEATATIFIDFDGATVRDTVWGNINAPASPLSARQRRDVWRRVKEDFLPFNINITTDHTVYSNTPAGMKMRCIVTPDDTAAPGAGGVAILTSFHYAGDIFLANIPCWCFNPGVKAGADTVSHEVGHTLGLEHDGLYTPTGYFEYYGGHGTGPTSWGPIMGAPFTRTLTQWSLGEYYGANKIEDDMEIIASPFNGFGYAPDDFGDTPATASPFQYVNNVIDQHGFIGELGDVDVFTFTTKGGGSMLMSASGIGSGFGNLDVRMDLLASDGTLISKNKFTRSLGAGLVAGIGPGTYYVRIQGTAEGDPLGTGYTRYGSRGAYTVTGRVPF